MPHQNSVFSRVLTAALVFAFTSSVLSAAVTQTSSSTAPSTGLIATSEDPQNLSNAALGVRWDTSSSSHRDVSQSFLSSSATTLNSFTFKLTFDQTIPAGVVNAPFTIKLYEVGSASAMPDAGGSVLVSTQSGVWTVPAGTAASSYITFNLDPVSLGAGKYYSFAFGFDSSAAGRNFLVATRDSGFYPSGVAAGLVYPYDPVTAGTPGAWTAFGATADFIFYANTASAVPEPSTTALLIGGVMLSAAIMRRRSLR